MRFSRVFPALLLACSMLRAAPAPANALQRSIEETIARSGLTVGVAIKDLTSGEEFLARPDDVFPQGSSIRIHIVAELFRQAAAGRLSLDAPRALPDSEVTGGSGVLRYMHRDTLRMSLRDYAVLMIAANDHSAANFLTDVVGMDNVNASLAAQGTPEIRFRRRAVRRLDAPTLPENEATPRASMRALELIYGGKVVDRATSDAILQVLAVSEVTYFHRPLPASVAFAGRSGSGPEMRCDVGIVLLPERPFILCVMVKDLGLPVAPPRNYARADAVISAITQRAYRHFAALARSAGAQPPAR